MYYRDIHVSIFKEIVFNFFKKSICFFIYKIWQFATFDTVVNFLAQLFTLQVDEAIKLIWQSCFQNSKAASRATAYYYILASRLATRQIEVFYASAITSFCGKKMNSYNGFWAILEWNFFYLIPISI